MEEIDPEILQRVLSVDWVSIFLRYPGGGITSKEFRLEEKERKIELATRYGEILSGWQGYIILQKDPVLHLTRIDGKNISLDIPLPPLDSPRDMFVTRKTSLGDVTVRFTKSLSD